MRPSLRRKLGEVRLGEPKGFHIPTIRIFHHKMVHHPVLVLYISVLIASLFSFETGAAKGRARQASIR